jgi:hypothetical protein
MARAPTSKDIENTEQLLQDITERPDMVIKSTGFDAAEMDFMEVALRHALIGMRPIPMLLFCPACAKQHVDKIEPEKNWANPPHKSHLCGGCGHVWRPADVPTTGVEQIETKGTIDRSAVPVALPPPTLAQEAFDPLTGTLGINSQHNACMFRETCRALLKNTPTPNGNAT